jgi:hypothetical protein
VRGCAGRAVSNYIKELKEKEDQNGRFTWTQPHPTGFAGCPNAGFAMTSRVSLEAVFADAICGYVNRAVESLNPGDGFPASIR